MKKAFKDHLNAFLLTAGHITNITLGSLHLVNTVYGS